MPPTPTTQRQKSAPSLPSLASYRVCRKIEPTRTIASRLFCSRNRASLQLEIGPGTLHAKGVSVTAAVRCQEDAKCSWHRRRLRCRQPTRSYFRSRGVRVQYGMSTVVKALNARRVTLVSCRWLLKAMVAHLAFFLATAHLYDTVILPLVQMSDNELKQMIDAVVQVLPVDLAR